MWQQVHEMLFIERGGEAQIPDELEAYNPLIPQGRELVATMMFEIDNPVTRKAVLGKLGGVEETVFMRLDGERIVARAEADVDRRSEEHTSELQSLMRHSYAVFCLKQQTNQDNSKKLANRSLTHK